MMHKLRLILMIGPYTICVIGILHAKITYGLGNKLNVSTDMSALNVMFRPIGLGAYRCYWIYLS